MELCSQRLVSNLPHPRLFNHKSFPVRFTGPLTSKSIPSSLSKSGFVFIASPPRCTTSGEISSSLSEQFDEGPNKKITTEDSKGTEDLHNEPIEIEYAQNTTEEGSLPSEEAPFLSRLQAFQFLHGLKEKLNPEDAYPFLLYGSGALVAIWISTAIVGAIDSIPVFPKVLEVVGLGYTVWFSYRYLIFKKNRDELLTKIEELKREIIGESAEH
ncbi:protein CURVATURE THYLAKOID 1D, chloroplastic-like [Aristolochia californica]|uniref:protein CURVATURE THYLAKOID 1D, chloroplastic-like n=1 Tax=Aristolochia californica TaxID=171875 RepID=UPI0035DB417B